MPRLAAKSDEIRGLLEQRARLRIERERVLTRSRRIRLIVIPDARVAVTGLGVALESSLEAQAAELAPVAAELEAVEQELAARGHED